MDSEKVIHDEMLGSISDEYDKREGSFIFIATKPAAVKFADVEGKIIEAKEKFDVEEFEGEELERYVKQRTGQNRRQATKAIGFILATGNGVINTGDLFETQSGIQFEAVETLEISDETKVNIKCVTPGSIGVVPANQITKIPITLGGITSVTNPEPTYDGFEAESDEDLLTRYYEIIRIPATSGNKYHYVSWAKEVEGVGEARVFPLWNGDNTVKVVIIDAERKPPSVELIESVQNYIDPDGKGSGEGQAPIGAFCSVVGAIAKNIDISFTVTKEEGYLDEEIITNVSSVITEHFKEIAFQTNIVSYAKVGSLILNTEGVADYSNLLIDNSIDNITVETNEVAVLGGVTLV